MALDLYRLIPLSVHASLLLVLLIISSPCYELAKPFVNQHAKAGALRVPLGSDGPPAECSPDTIQSGWVQPLRALCTQIWIDATQPLQKS